MGPRAVALLALLAAGCTESSGSSTPPRADAALADLSPADDTPTDLAAPDATSARHVPTPFAPTEATRRYCGGGDDDVVEARITELLGALTLDEKVAMMAGAGVNLVDRAWRVPGHEGLRVPGLRMLDGPRGLSVQTRVPATAFPVAMLRGASWDPALERRVGEAIAEEIRSVGADVVLAPTINLLRHPRWGRAQETYGEDTHHVGAMGVAFIEGAQSRGVLASVKHYAANSIENTRHSVDVRLDARALREVYLPHFRRAVRDARVASVMTAYNRVNGAWSDQSAALVRDILKGEWGFAGFVESDWILGTHGDVASLRAGLDIEMPLNVNYRRLPGAVARGELREHEIDDSVRRIVRAQLCYGLDARPRVLDDPSRRLTAAHRALAREAAREGVVLLKNEAVRGAPALPLGAAVRRVAVLGRNADVENLGDRGSSDVLPGGEVVTALEGIRARPGVMVTHVAGTTLDAMASEAVRGADAVVVVTGMQSGDEGEGEIGAGDRASLALPPAEVALIRAAAALNPRVAVVIEAGAAVTVGEWGDAVPAILWAGYPGSEGGAALAELLFGDRSPGGRLPFTVPRREEDLVSFDNASPTVTYGYLHGYRHLAATSVAPAFPFGHGLAYSRFERSGLTLSRESVAMGDAVEVSVEVRNAGGARATDTVQVYVTAEGSRVMRAPRDLRGFARVELGPGESRRVTIPLRADDLAYWDEGGGRWVLEPIAYTVTVAENAAAAGLTATLRGR